MLRKLSLRKVPTFSVLGYSLSEISFIDHIFTSFKICKIIIAQIQDKRNRRVFYLSLINTTYGCIDSSPC